MVFSEVLEDEYLRFQIPRKNFNSLNQMYMFYHNYKSFIENHFDILVYKQLKIIDSDEKNLVIVLDTLNIRKQFMAHQSLLELICLYGFDKFYFNKSKNLYTPNSTFRDILYLENINNQNENYDLTIDEFSKLGYKVVLSKHFRKNIKSCYIFGFEEKPISLDLIGRLNELDWAEYNYKIFLNMPEKIVKEKYPYLN